MDNILLTRPEHQAEPLKSELEQFGFAVFVQPVIEILPPDNWDEVDSVINEFQINEEGGWTSSASMLVFTSSNGIRFFFERVKEKNNAKLPAGLFFSRFAVVGTETNETLKQYIKRDADIIPSGKFNAEGLLEEFRKIADKIKRMKNQSYEEHPHILIVCGSRRKETLPKGLTELGAKVRELTIYQSIDVQEIKPEIAAMMKAGQFDWTTATSPASAKSLVRLFGNDLRKTKIVSISPAVSEVLRQAGFTTALEAKQSSSEGIIAALR